MVVILAAIGTSSYSKSKNKALSREAIANLRLIAAAERIYKMESNTGVYVACANATACNTELKLNLNATNWGYEVVDVSGSGATATATINAIGTSTGISGCTYTFENEDFDNTNGYSTKTTGVCP
jgi:type II secretory pathway pseudopilin PulG